MRSVRILAVTLAALLVTGLAHAGDEPPTAKPHTDEQLEAQQVFERFEADFASDDLDRRLRILRWLGHWRHDDVLKTLKKVLFKEKDRELQAAAAWGVGNQAHDPKDAKRVLYRALDRFKRYGSRTEIDDLEVEALNNEEVKVLVNVIQGLGRLHPFDPRRHKNDGWKSIEKMIDHNSDDVAIATFAYVTETKEYRALPTILEWFNFYPEGYQWAGASARVDTGTAGNKDQKAARSKALRKANSRRKSVRPAAWEAMVGAVKALTGKAMKKPKELKAWMEENERFLKKQGV